MESKLDENLCKEHCRELIKKVADLINEFYNEKLKDTPGIHDVNIMLNLISNITSGFIGKVVQDVDTPKNIFNSIELYDKFCENIFENLKENILNNFQKN